MSFDAYGLGDSSEMAMSRLTDQNSFGLVCIVSNSIGYYSGLYEIAIKVFLKMSGSGE